MLIQIPWNYRTMRDWVVFARKRIDPTTENYLFGFSYGAMIALILATEMKSKTIILCSLSPYFKEDLPRVPSSWKAYIGKRRIRDFATLSFKRLASKVTSRTILTVGEHESNVCHSRVRDAHLRLKNSRLVIIKGAKHNIHQKEYLAAVERIIRSL